MKVEVLPENLKAGLAWVKPGISPASVLAVLKNVMVEVTWQGVRLTATNLGLTVSALIGGKVSQRGRTTVPFKDLETIAKTVPDESFALSTRNGSLKLSQGNRVTTIGTIDAKEFPKMRLAKGEGDSDVEGLPTACRFVQHALAKDQGRPVLACGELRDGNLAAADGFRLAVAPACKGNGMLSGDLVRFLARAKEEPTKLAIAEGVATVWYGENWVTGILEEGNYPKWELIVPKSPRCTIKVDFYEFLAKVLLLARLYSKGSARYGSETLFLKPKRGRLYLQGQGEKTKTTDWLAASCHGDLQIVAINMGYLLDDLQVRKPHMDKGLLVIQTDSPSSPILFTDKDTPFMEVIMPMRIRPEDLEEELKGEPDEVEAGAETAETECGPETGERPAEEPCAQNAEGITSS